MIAPPRTEPRRPLVIFGVAGLVVGMALAWVTLFVPTKTAVSHARYCSSVNYVAVSCGSPVQTLPAVER